MPRRLAYGIEIKDVLTGTFLNQSNFGWGWGWGWD